MQVEYVDLRLPEHREDQPFYIGSIQSIGVDVKAYLPSGPVTIKGGSRVAIPLGFAIEIPEGYYGRLAPRSGLAYKFGIDVLAGVIDPDFRGEVKAILLNTGFENFVVHTGDRVAQMILEDATAWTPSEKFSLRDTDRGVGGWGSTGVA